MNKSEKRPPKRVVYATKASKVAPTKKPAAGKVAAKSTSNKTGSKPADIKKPAKGAAPVAKDKAIVKKAGSDKKDNKKDEGKKPVAVAAPATSSKSGVKEKVQEKIAVGVKKADAPRPQGAAAKAAPAPQPIKVEPKIIENPQPEYKKPPIDGDLFSDEELEEFRRALNVERDKILLKARRAMADGGIAIDKNEMMDEVDQASAMAEQNLMFRLLDRDRKLLAEIDHAIQKLDSGEFGYCEGTGEAIPKRRLELRPWCRHSVKYKERLERMKKSGRGVVDEDEI